MGRDATQIRIGPGTLYVAPLASTVPTDLVTAWDAAWLALGYTDNGHEMDYTPNYNDINVEEELEPVLLVADKRDIHWKFTMKQINAKNLQLAENGGTITTSGGVTKFVPPILGSEVYTMIGWQAADSKERLVIRKALQIGSINTTRQKAPNASLIPADFRVLSPGSGVEPYFHLMDSSLAA